MAHLGKYLHFTNEEAFFPTYLDSKISEPSLTLFKSSPLLFPVIVLILFLKFISRVSSPSNLCLHSHLAIPLDCMLFVL